MSRAPAAKRERLRAFHEKFVVELRERTAARKTRLNFVAYLANCRRLRAIDERFAHLLRSAVPCRT